MTIREEDEQRELVNLSPYAAMSVNSRGRDRAEEPCDIRTCYQRDRDRIIHCKAFRRLKHKMQVFLAPSGDHYRTRLTHTLEVSQTARTIARALRLNEDLTEAIALGHDLGHTPFGHSGEYALNIALEGTGFTFRHNLQSVRVVEKLEKEGKGLNLTWEVRDGIKNHGTKGSPSTLEGKIVRLCDKVAYINHDIDDAIRAGVLTEEALPAEYTSVLGSSVRSRLNRMIHDIIACSRGTDDVRQSEECAWAMAGLRNFMFEQVYKNSVVKAQDEKINKLIVMLYRYYLEHIDDMPEDFSGRALRKEDPAEIVVCDYIAGMTDQFAIARFEDLFVPTVWLR